MAEDDVERLVAEAMEFHEMREVRLARIVRELLAEHPVGECMKAWDEDAPPRTCQEVMPLVPAHWCLACMDSALRARLNAIARGEEA